MYKIIISRLRQGTRRSSGNTCSIKKLLCRESRKDLYDKNANEKGVDMVSLDRDTMIRISKNPGWYQDFYKSYGRAPNTRELYDIAHKKMEDEVYYNLDKNDVEGMAEKETMEAAKKRVESLERVKNIVDKFDNGDIVAQSLLDPETYEQVYKPTVETLSQGNATVKKSARDSALILSKMAENFHKNYGVPLKMAAVEIAKENNETSREKFFSPANRDVNPDYELNVVDITKYIPSEPVSKKDLRDYVKKYLYNRLNQQTNDGKAIIKIPESGKRQNHIADSS